MGSTQEPQLLAQVLFIIDGGKGKQTQAFLGAWYVVGDEHTPVQILAVLVEISGLVFSEKEDTNFSGRIGG